jgi:hypothetical protein
MKNTRIHLESSSSQIRQFRTAASLHSHTLYSHETLSFVNRLSRHFAPLRGALRKEEAYYRHAHGSALDLSRAWWTPPCAPRDAWSLERRQIEEGLGLQALVSLTDHDSIEAPLSLRVLAECQNTPISLEWTTPYKATFFHLGVHNIPAEDATAITRQLASFTQAPDLTVMKSLLETLAANKETLLIFNHPCWDEKGIGYQQHVALAAEFIREYRRWIHALELNGLRPWSGNRAVVRLATELEMPLVSGGDRHALEPNTILDLTNATTFPAYVEQVRSGYTEILITDQYREPFTLRIIQNIEEIMQEQPDHGWGWVRWSDRVFYECDDGEVRSLTTLFANRVPRAVTVFVKAIGMMRRYSLRSSCRFAFPRQELVL